MWARLDGCILDKIPWARVSGASWAGRGGQSCCVQLRILDITVLVAWVLETREARCVWGVRQPKQIDIYESVREKQIDTVREAETDKTNKQKPKKNPVMDTGRVRLSQRRVWESRVTLQFVRHDKHGENNGQTERMGKEMRGQRWGRTWIFCLHNNTCVILVTTTEKVVLLFFISFSFGLFCVPFPGWNQRTLFLPSEGSNDILKHTVLDAGRHNYVVIFI